MKTGRVLIAGVTVTIFNAIVGAVTCGGIFSWVYQLEPINVWKPMGNNGPGLTFMIYSLILSIIFALVYALIYKGLPGSNKLVKGLVFGLCVWAVGMLPGMLATYSFMTVAPTVIIYWTVMGLIKTPLEGMIVAAIYGK